MQTSDHAPAGEVATGITEEQAASELLKRWGAKEDAPQGQSDDASPDPDGAQGSADDQPQGDSQSDDQPSDKPDGDESGDIEIDVAGEKFKVPASLKEQAERIQAKAKEVEAGATRKFQEAADARKAAEARAEQVDRMQKIAHAQADLLADHRFVMKRLAAYEQINVAELSQTDPVRLGQINAEYNQLSAARGRLEQALQRAVSDYDAETTKTRETRRQSLLEYASKNVKGWGAEADRNLNEYLGGKGIERETMLTFLEQEPRLLTILEEAVYGQKVRTAAPQKTPPKSQTIKPGGAGGSKTSAQQAVETANRRLGQTGKVDDAAAALLARMNARKR
jgi:hypothetical protein